MQHTARLVQIAASRRSPALIAGLGAAFVASDNTLSVMMSLAAPVTAPRQAADGGSFGDRLVLPVASSPAATPKSLSRVPLGLSVGFRRAKAHR